MSRVRRRWLLFGSFALLVALALGLYLVGSQMSVPEAGELRPCVRSAPPVGVVFTSRTEPTSFEAAAPEGEGFAYPGTTPWAAREGRLRLLTARGRVYELTWGRALPDGGTLIDVMSPTVTADGTQILFAGRRAAPDPGRWRIYRVNVNGGNLRPVTGQPDDTGCVADPPLRFAADGSRLSSADRRRLDYDDVDPADDGAGGFYFASSRIPDLGRDHTCRATQIWYKPAAQAPRALTANRNNDRWPFLARESVVLFSLWSRNRESVTADLTDVRPVAAGAAYATGPTDTWVGARVYPDGTQFGYAVKIPDPVWRPRPLFNGRVAFTTTDPRTGGYRLAQADWGLLRAAPSSLASGSALPRQVGGDLVFGPDKDAEGRALSAGGPTPCPGGMVVFAGAPAGTAPGGYGLYLVPEEWSPPQTPVLLFDDPALVDAEPVAVYPREVAPATPDPPTGGAPPAPLDLLPNRVHRGATGQIDNNIINQAMPDRFPGQVTDAGASPVVPNPTGIKSVVFFGAHRDRFDDPVAPRVPGGWERLLVAPLGEGGVLKTWLPADPLMPTVLAGLDESGRVVRSSGAKDREGRSATFYALAGDHYSGTRPNGYHFCIGCHAGHTFIKADIRERSK